MKAYLRVAAVTAAMQELLLPAVHAVVPDGLVKTGIPFDGTRQKQFQGINLFLFQVERNASLANQDLAARAEDGSFLQAPVAAIDLHYLLTFYGDESQLVPQKLLGAAVSWIHTWPVLSHADLQYLAQRSPGGIIDESGIADQIETVILTQLPLGIEAMMRLWTVFMVPYTLTVACRASVILLEAVDSPPPKPNPKKLRIAFGSSPIPITELSDVHFDLGDVLEVQMPERREQAVNIALGNAPVKPEPAQGSTVDYTMTPELSVRHGLRPGPNPIRLVDNGGTPVAEKSFTLRPAIQRVSRQTTAPTGILRPGDPRKFTLTAVIMPPVAEGQTIALSLAPIGKNATPPRPSSVSRTAAGEISAVFDGVRPGSYRVSVLVDGVPSKPLPMPRSGLPVDAIQVS